MVLFLILLLMLIALIVVSVFCLSVGGTFFIVLFSDVIVCAAIIVWIMKKMTKKSKPSYWGLLKRQPLLAFSSRNLQLLLWNK